MNSLKIHMVRGLDAVFDSLCIATAGCAAILTVASLTRIISNTENPFRWAVFFYISFGIFGLNIISYVLNFIVFRLWGSKETYQRKINISAKKTIKLEHAWTQAEKLCLLFFAVNMANIFLVCKGDGRNLTGSWLVSASRIPCMYCALAAIPLYLRRRLSRTIFKWHPDYNQIRNKIEF